MNCYKKYKKDDKGLECVKKRGDIGKRIAYIMGMGICTYVFTSTMFNSLSPKNWMNEIEKQEKRTAKIDSFYNEKIKYCKTLKDSIIFYHNNGLEKYIIKGREIKLEEPSSRDKERVVNQTDDFEA